MKHDITVSRSGWSEESERAGSADIPSTWKALDPGKQGHQPPRRTKGELVITMEVSVEDIQLNVPLILLVMLRDPTNILTRRVTLQISIEANSL